MLYVVDFDDLYDGVAERSLEFLKGLKGHVKGLKVTLFTIPQRTSQSTVDEFKKYDWIALAPHGWQHTRGECLAWTSEEGQYKILAARDKGIDAPVFRAPAWLLDSATYEACRQTDTVVADHKDYRVNAMAQVYTYNAVDGKQPKVRSIHGHLTQCRVDNFIGDMFTSGRLNFHQAATFSWPWSVSVPNPLADLTSTPPIPTEVSQ